MAPARPRARRAILLAAGLTRFASGLGGCVLPRYKAGLTASMPPRPVDRLSAVLTSTGADGPQRVWGSPAELECRTYWKRLASTRALLQIVECFQPSPHPYGDGKDWLYTIDLSLPKKEGKWPAVRAEVERYVQQLRQAIQAAAIDARIGTY